MIGCVPLSRPTKEGVGGHDWERKLEMNIEIILLC